VQISFIKPFSITRGESTNICNTFFFKFNIFLTNAKSFWKAIKTAFNIIISPNNLEKMLPKVLIMKTWQQVL